MSNFYLEDDSRLALMSFMAIGNDAETCLRAIMRDIDTLPRRLSPDLSRFMRRFLDPSADITFLLLSGGSPISSERLRSVCGSSC